MSVQAKNLPVALGPFAEESKGDQNTVTFIGGFLDSPNEFCLRSTWAARVRILYFSGERVLFSLAFFKLSCLAFDGYIAGN
jgi:hypothetical protein